MPDEYDDLLDSLSAPKRTPARAPGREKFVPPNSSWSVSDIGKVKDFYRSKTGRDLPVRNQGQGNIHNSQGWDHRNAADISLNPSTPEGQELLNYLRQNNIPFNAFTGAAKSRTGKIASTGAHIHVGLPSSSTNQRYAVGTTLDAKPVDAGDEYDQLLDSLSTPEPVAPTATPQQVVPGLNIGQRAPRRTRTKPVRPVQATPLSLVPGLNVAAQAPVRRGLFARVGKPVPQLAIADVRRRDDKDTRAVGMGEVQAVNYADEQLRNRVRQAIPTEIGSGNESYPKTPEQIERETDERFVAEKASQNEMDAFVQTLTPEEKQRIAGFVSDQRNMGVLRSLTEGTQAASGTNVRRLANVLNLFGQSPVLEEAIRQGGGDPNDSIANNLYRRGKVAELASILSQQEHPEEGLAKFRDAILRGVGSASVDVPLMMLASPALKGATLPAFGASEAIDRGLGEAAKAGAEGYLYHRGMKATAPLGRALNAGIWTTIPTVKGVAEGQDWAEALGGAIPLGLLSAGQRGSVARERLFRERGFEPYVIKSEGKTASAYVHPEKNVIYSRPIASEKSRPGRPVVEVSPETFANIVGKGRFNIVRGQVKPEAEATGIETPAQRVIAPAPRQITGRTEPIENQAVAPIPAPDLPPTAPEAVRPTPTIPVQPQGEIEPATATPKTIIRHADPRIDGGEIVGRTNDGKLKVANNEGGISVVRNPRTSGNQLAAIQKVREEDVRAEGQRQPPDVGEGRATGETLGQSAGERAGTAGTGVVPSNEARQFPAATKRSPSGVAPSVPPVASAALDVFEGNEAAARQRDTDPFRKDTQGQLVNYRTLVDIENGLGTFSNRGISEQKSRDAGRLYDAINKRDLRTVTAIAQKYEKARMSGDSIVGGPKEVKVGDAVGRAIGQLAHNARFDIERMAARSSQSQGQPLSPVPAAKINKSQGQGMQRVSTPVPAVEMSTVAHENSDKPLRRNYRAEIQRAQTAAPTPARETVTPSKDVKVGQNASGESLYERADGQRYRMRFDRKDRPNGYPDFGGDLVPVAMSAPEKPARVLPPRSVGEAKQPHEMTREEYRREWYKNTSAKPPANNERLTVRQRTDERLAREGWVVRVANAVRDGKPVSEEIKKQALRTAPILYKQYSQPQNKPASVEPSTAPKVEPIYRRMRESDTPLTDARRDEATRRGRVIRPQVEVTKGEVRAASRIATRKRAESGEPLRSAAWHGSPHRFDKFSLSKIGTGEGAQAYGHGLYFTDKREVAEFYKQKLSPVRVEYKGEKMRFEGKDYFDLQQSARKYVPRFSVFPTTEDVREAVKRYVRDEILASGNVAKGFDIADSTLENNEQETKDSRIRLPQKEYHNLNAFNVMARREFNKLNQADFSLNKGRLYHVDLKPEESDYLLWDKPLSEQSEKVRESLWNDRRFLDLMQQTANPSGSEIYSFFAGRVGGERASNDLHSLGIRGIKYLDGSSRGQGEGSYNYVIFDDADVSITEVLAQHKEEFNKKLDELVTKPVPEIVKGMKWSATRPNEIQLNPEAYLVLHGAYNQMMDGFSGFTGVFNDRANANKLASTLLTAANYYGREGRKMWELAQDVRKVSRANGTVILYTDKGALLEERHHQASYKAAEQGGDTDLRARHAHFDELYNSPVMRKARPKLLEGYADRPGLLVEELAPKLADGLHEEYGLTLDEADQWMRLFYRSLAEKNGVESLKHFQEIQDASRQTIERLEAAKQSGSGLSSVPQQQGQVRGRTEQGNERVSGKESQALQSAAKGVESFRLIPQAPTFYSQLERTISAKMPNRVSTAQLRSLISNPQSGVKPDEVKWSGLDDYLQGKEFVTKQEVLDYLKANNVKVEEVVKGNETTKKDERRSGAIRRLLVNKGYTTSTSTTRAGDFKIVKLDGTEPQRLPDDIAALAKELREVESRAFSSPTKFSQYTLPGAKEGSYRELLLTLPPKEELPPGFEVFKADNGSWGIKFPNGTKLDGWNSREDAVRSQGRQAGSPVYKSSHFDEPNVLAHIRFNTRYIDEASEPSGGGKVEVNIFGREVSPLLREQVESPVVGLAHHDQVQRLIVSLLPVDVVNDLRSLKLSPQDLFRNEAVGKQLLSAPADKRLRILRGVVSALGKANTSLRAKVIDSLHRGVDSDILPALRTSDLKGSDVASLLNSSPSVLRPSSLSTQRGAEATSTVGRAEILPATENTGARNSRQSALAGAVAGGSQLDVGGKLSPARIAELVDRHRDIIAKSGKSEKKNRQLKVLFIEEIQSDWHQEGRKKGYTPKDAAKLEARRREIEALGRKATSEQKQEWADIMNQLRPDTRDYGGNTGYKGVPDAPFKKNWHELAMRRALRHAAENGYDKLAFTTGGQQAERYDLSKQVDGIIIQKVVKDGKESFNIHAYMPNRSFENQQTKVAENVPLEKLEEHIGKDLAEKSQAITAGSSKVFEGVDLKVGGEGMKGFYDRILPSYLAKYGRKWGAAVGTTKIQVKEPHDAHRQFRIGRTWYHEGNFGADWQRENGVDISKVKVGSTLPGVGKVVEIVSHASHRTELVHSIEITPSMRKSVMEEGQPLFKRSLPPSSRAGEAGFINLPSINELKRFARKAPVELLNAPRALKSSIDAPIFRQGVVFTLTNPKAAVGEAYKMFGAYFSEKSFNETGRKIATDVDYELSKKSGIRYSMKGLRQRGASEGEEEYQSSWAEKLPHVKYSEQAYVAFLDLQRLDNFKRLIKGLRRRGWTFESHPAQYKAIATFVNAATGKGVLGSALEKALPLLNTTFYSTRYQASRAQLLNPLYYIKQPKGVRLRIAREMLQYWGTVAALLGIAQWLGAEVETEDPTSSDFGKVKVGNTRYDIGGGQLQWITFFSRLAKSIKGRIEGDKKADVMGVVSRFFRSKLAPVPSSVWNLAEGKNMVGEKVTVGSEALQQFLPMFVMDMIEIAKTEGAAGVAKTVPFSLLGMGVQTYEKKQAVRSVKRPTMSRPTLRRPTVRVN